MFNNQTTEISNKPVTLTCMKHGCCGVLWSIDLSRMETCLNHEGFKCDTCGRRVKYVPKEGV